MGVYAYKLNHEDPIQTPDGPVYRFEFGWRMCDDLDREQNRAKEHVEDEWSALVIEGEVSLPILTTVGRHDGASVFRQYTISPVWVDCFLMPGEFVGYLSKGDGDEWSIRSLEDCLKEDIEFLGEYITRHDFWGDVPSMFDGSLEGRVSMYLEAAHRHLSAPYMVDGVFRVPEDEYVREMHDRMRPIWGHVERAKRMRRAA